METVINMPEGLDGHTAHLVTQFAEALAKKLYRSQMKYNYTDNWKRSGWMDECRQELRMHLEKGDPLDVAAYCAFLFFHEASTLSA